MMETSDKVLKWALQKGATDAIATTFVTDTWQARFSNSDIDIAKNWRETSVSLFVAVGKRVAEAEMKNPRRFEEGVAELLRTARASQEKPTYRGIAEGKFRYRSARVDPAVVKMEKGGDLIHEGIEAAAREGASECAGTLARVHHRAFLASSRGPIASGESATLHFSLRAFCSEEASGHEVLLGTRRKGFDTAAVGRKAGEIARLAKAPRSGEAGKFDVVFAPLLFGSFIDWAGVMASAFYVQAGFSMYAGKLGKSVASEKVTILEDPTASMNGRRFFDDEGSPTKKNVLVHKGKLKTYLHNTSTARLMKTKSTASAGVTVPHPSNMILEAGDWKHEELLEELRDGLYLTNAWYLRFQNRLTGDFSTLPRDGAFRVKDGEIVASWRGIRVSENLLRLFQNVKALSRERQEVQWWGEVFYPTLSPSVLVRDVNLTKSTE